MEFWWPAYGQRRLALMPTFLSRWLAFVALRLLISTIATVSVATYQAMGELLNATAGPILVDVTAFGARPGVEFDNGPAFSAALRALHVEVGGRIVVPPGIYKIDSSVEIPKFGGNAVLDFEMSGATLRTEAPIAILSRMPKDQSEAQRIVGSVFRFHGGRFVGSSRPGQIGLRLGATYASFLDGVQFDRLEIGFDGYFNLDLRIQNVRATANAMFDIRVGSGAGKWPGATIFNAGSNHTTIDGVRIYSAKDAIANIAIYGASGVSIRNSIVEGEDPTDAILYDNQGAVTQVFIIDNLHSESTPSNAIIRIAGKKAGMIYSISNIFFQTARTLIDARDIGVSIIDIRNVPYVASLREGFLLSPGSGGVFGTLWRFDNWPGDIFEQRWWAGGRRPMNLLSSGRNDPRYGARIAADPLALGARGGKARVSVEGEFSSQRLCLLQGPGDRDAVCIDKEGLRKILAR